MSDDFNVAVPQDELDARPNFKPMPVGWYQTTIQAGTQIVEGKNNPNWRGIRVPFSGFSFKKTGETFEKDRNYQVTTAGDNAESVRIGRQQLVALAVAFGLAEDTTVDGKPAKKLTANSIEEFVDQLNAVAGSPCDVYGTNKKRTRNGAVVMRDDGQGPVMDFEITRVAALGEGK